MLCVASAAGNVPASHASPTALRVADHRRVVVDERHVVPWTAVNSWLAYGPLADRRDDAVRVEVLVGGDEQLVVARELRLVAVALGRDLLAEAEPAPGRTAA